MDLSTLETKFMICTKCGDQVPAGAQFCGNCGAQCLTGSSTPGQANRATRLQPSLPPQRVAQGKSTPWLCQIWRRESETWQFVGNGLSVADGLVLTCLHVVREDDPDIFEVRIGAETARVSKISAGDMADVALLLLTKSIKLNHARFAPEWQPLSKNKVKIRIKAWQKIGEAVEIQTVDNPELRPLIAKRDWRIEHGMPEGFSGCPLVLDADRVGAVVGILDRGGRGRPFSTVIPAALICEFLQKEHRPFRTVLVENPIVSRRQAGWGMLALASILFVVLGFRHYYTSDTNQSPMAGTWEAQLPDRNGSKQTCLLSVSDLGMAQFSDSCPFPLTAKRIGLEAVKDSIMAPALFQTGDDGTFSGIGGDFSGSFKREGSSRLITRDAQYGSITWEHATQTPGRSEIDSMLAPTVDWPLKGVPTVARKALSFVQSRWQPDAKLVSIKISLLASNNAQIASAQSKAGPINMELFLYSPQLRQTLLFYLNSLGGMQILGNARLQQQFLPTEFVDLPDAVSVVRSRGMRGQIDSAELEYWGSGEYSGGFEWVINSGLEERARVSASLSRLGEVAPGMVLGQFCQDCTNDRQCFLKYNTISLLPRCDEFTRDDILICSSYWKASDPTQLSAARTACEQISMREPDNDNLKDIVSDIERRLREATTQSRL